jgi:uncharacterized LabA/DUF88 family protein
MANERRLAMLIDGDNAQPSLIEEMLAEASKYGVITIRRIYGDWTESTMNGWKSSLNTHAVQPIQQFRYTVGKNATDSALIIDAMDIMYTAGVDGFCLVSSDSDYTRLATRIREKNLFVMGIGKQNTPRPFVNACDVFVYTENLRAQSAAQPVTAPEAKSITETTSKPPSGSSASAKKPAKQPSLDQLFEKAFEAAVADDGWATVAELGNKLRQLDPAFDPRTYGHTRLQPLVQANVHLFEISKNSKDAMTVRLKVTPNAKPTAKKKAT